MLLALISLEHLDLGQTGRRLCQPTKSSKPGKPASWQAENLETEFLDSAAVGKVEAAGPRYNYVMPCQKSHAQ